MLSGAFVGNWFERIFALDLLSVLSFSFSGESLLRDFM